jgi:phosphoribosylformylglycinamidine synthase
MTSELVNLDIALKHGLSEDEYNKIISILGRVPNLTELGIFSAMWSEHCSYKSTKIHLKELPTSAPWVICGPGENAGVIDIGDEQAIIFKMESHNHPSYIEPYQGAATGVGGIMRDVFTMGARPIANLNSLRFGAPDHPKTRYLLSQVVAGIGGYGNSVGVPTVGGECTFHPAYNGNILVNAMTVGLADKNKIFYSKASTPGSQVVYVGSKTGRDGIHGATMSSAEFGEGSETKRPMVQVGDPFAEKLLLEACLELMSQNAILSIQDMGAAGLTSSSLEMAGKGGVGIELELDKVPTRESNMTPYEIMLSESQERMLMVVKPEQLAQVQEICNKWELDCVKIGQITSTGNVVLKMKDKIVVDMAIAPLHESAPSYNRPFTIDEAKQPIQVSGLEALNDINGYLLKLLSSFDLCSKKWIYQQYDSMVMTNTVRGPGGDAAIVRVGKEKAIAVASDCTPRYCVQDPYMGAMQAVAENWRNLICAGSKPLAITDCLNFGNPEKPQIMGQIVSAIKGIGAACRALDFPVISGNVSLYNETNGNAILPTPSIGGVGLIKNVNNCVRNSFMQEDDIIIIIGGGGTHLGASIFLREIMGREEGNPPLVDLELEKKNGNFVSSLIEAKKINACHDISDGGLYVALAEMAISSKIGADIKVTSTNLIAELFGEDQARYIITCANADQDTILKAAQAADVAATVIGKTTKDKLILNSNYQIEIKQLQAAHSNTLPSFFHNA